VVSSQQAGRIQSDCLFPLQGTLLGVARRQHILDGLVDVLQIVDDLHMVLDLEPDDRRGDEQGAAQKTPVAGEFGHEFGLLRIPGPHNGGAGRLDALVETDVVGRTTTRVAERAHEPSGMVSQIS
jgi:hypothetical protein